MNKPQFTPGPWHCAGLAVVTSTKYENGNAVRQEISLFPSEDCEYPDTDSRMIRTQRGFTRIPGEDEAIANARLIAAAPELYAALENILEHRERMGLGSDHVYEAARAALAKATS